MTAQRQYADLLRREDVRASFAQIASHSTRNIETAAFLLRHPDGSITLLQWPYNGRFRGAEWRGPLPANAIAVVHTHPNGWFHASDHDVTQAVRTGLPIFVLTHQGISVADPVSGRNVVLKRGREELRPSFARSVASRAAPAEGGTND